MKKLFKPQPLFTPHHSAGDWDFLGAYEYSIARYISPPTSLTSTAGVAHAVCKAPGTTKLPSGDIRLWIWEPLATYVIIHFRRQDPIDNLTPNPRTYYIIARDAPFFDTALIYDNFPAPSVLVGTFPYVWPQNEWIHLRVEFLTFNGGDPLNPLAVNFYVEEAGSWVQKGTVVFDEENHWAESDPCRVGFTVANGSWVDDVEVREPAT